MRIDSRPFCGGFGAHSVIYFFDRLDKQHIFAQPVSRILVPDYHDLIKFPMDLATMGEKIDQHEYLRAEEFTVSRF